MYISSDELIEVFEDTKNWYQTDETLRAAIAETIKNTELYIEDDDPALPESKAYDDTIVSIGKYRTFETAQYYKRKYPDLRVAVLNFASATNPGGGVTSGSHAQEEALCRCSTLYPTLATEDLWNRYYDFHRKNYDVRYTDACIYTPDVLVIKSDTDNPQRLSKDKWIKVDVLTCAAPNLRPRPSNKYNPVAGKAINVSDEELFNLHVKRGKHIMTIAAHHKVDILILGAFGCGAFRNDPNIVANAYKEAVAQFKGYFKEIIFAVYCPPNRGNENFTVFAKVLK